MESHKKSSFLVLALAQGFGVGRVPVAPGTFGSLAGLAWFCALLALGNLWLYLIAAAAGVLLSVWICGAAERILRARDPSSVVLDEITAIPLCFLSFLISRSFSSGQLPEPAYLFQSPMWYITAGTFVLFRVFDILKPWPVRQSQRLPGGWGVTVDDVLAAVYVNLATLPFLI